MKKTYRITALALALLISLSVFAVSAFAADSESVTFSAKVIIDGPKPAPAEEYSIVLEPSDSSNPMPSGSKDGIYKLAIKGEGEADFPEIEFPALGVYQYKLYQLAGKTAGASYDRTVYTATVYVLNSETEEDKFELTVTLQPEGSEIKTDEIVFKNVYKDDPKTGDNSSTALYAALASVALMAIVLLLFRKKKQA